MVFHVRERMTNAAFDCLINLLLLALAPRHRLQPHHLHLYRQYQ